MLHILYEVSNCNKHYIKKYLDFCKRFNGSGNVRHHILPKAKDMFPQFKDLRIHPWNDCRLSERAHHIAHYMLWKALPNTQSVVYSAYRMNFRKTNSKEYSELRESYKNQRSINTTIQHQSMNDENRAQRVRKISAKTKGKVMAVDTNGVRIKIDKVLFDTNRNILSGHTKGTTTAKDINGNIISVPINDKRLVCGELVGVQKGNKFTESQRKYLSEKKKGVKFTEEHKQNMRKPKTRVICPTCRLEFPNNKIKRHTLKCNGPSEYH